MPPTGSVARILQTTDIVQKCRLVIEYLQNAHILELRLQFKCVLDALFDQDLLAVEYNDDPPGYGAVINLLAPNGPVFGAATYLYNQQPSTSLRYPVANLPRPLAAEVAIGRAPSCYIMQNVSTDRRYLLLNPVTYVLFTLIAYGLRPFCELPNSTRLEDMPAYFAVVARYVAHFFGETNEVIALQRIFMHPCGRERLVGVEHHCLLRQNVAHTDASILCDLLVDAVFELWFADGPPDRHHPLWYGTTSFIGQLHARDYFVSAAANRRPHLGHSGRRLYTFMMAGLATWPLDSSYELPLELWLAFIQPWRGANVHQALLDANGNIRRQYGEFVQRYLFFYNQLLPVALERVCHADLTVPVNVKFLSRICEVFSQDGLMYIVRLCEAMPSLKTYLAAEFGLFEHQLSTTNSDEWRAKALDMIASMSAAYGQIEASLRDDLRWPRTVLNYIRCLASATYPFGPTSLAASLDELRVSAGRIAAIFNVDAFENVTARFATAAAGGRDDPGRADDGRYRPRQAHNGGGGEGHHRPPANPPQPTAFSNGLPPPLPPPQGPRFGIRRAAVFSDCERYQVPPDRRPPAGDEVSLLLPVLACWSDTLNERFGRQLAGHYRRRYNSWKSFVITSALWAVTLPPTTFVQIVKEWNFTGERRHVATELDARFYLRPLARNSVCIVALLLVLGVVVHVAAAVTTLLS